MLLPEAYWRDDERGLVIYHGDCREVLPEFADGEFGSCITDPPYGTAGRDGAVHLEKSAGHGNRMSAESHSWLMWRTAAELHRVTREDAHCYVFSDWRRFGALRAAFETSGWECRSLLVWDKGNGMGHFWRSAHEFILFLTKEHPRRLSHGGCYNVLSCTPVPPSDRFHAAEKPDGLIMQLLEASICADSTSLDPYMGSGTTLVAAAKLGIPACGIEISEKYCEMAVCRLEGGFMDDEPSHLFNQEEETCETDQPEAR